VSPKSLKSSTFFLQIVKKKNFNFIQLQQKHIKILQYFFPLSASAHFVQLCIVGENAQNSGPFKVWNKIETLQSLFFTPQKTTVEKSLEIMYLYLQGNLKAIGVYLTRASRSVPTYTYILPPLLTLEGGTIGHPDLHPPPTPTSNTRRRHYRSAYLQPSPIPTPNIRRQHYRSAWLTPTAYFHSLYKKKALQVRLTYTRLLSPLLTLEEGTAGQPDSHPTPTPTPNARRRHCRSAWLTSTSYPQS
jgi:hypothetical protein